ncbi:MAG: hypothetical protein ACE5GK_04895 [Nitrospiria bacterium]
MSADQTIFRAVLDHGADVNVITVDGFSAEGIARKYAHRAVAKLLQAQGDQ